MEIKRSGSQPSGKGVRGLFHRYGLDRSTVRGTRPGSCSCRKRYIRAGGPAWHTHPLGQALIVTSGFGWVQRWGGPVEEIRPGDVIWFPPGEKHWHGATPSTAMTHIAIQEALDGSPVDWMEKVGDEQYRA